MDTIDKEPSPPVAPIVPVTPATIAPSTPNDDSFFTPPPFCGRVGIDVPATPIDVFLGRGHLATSDAESMSPTKEERKEINREVRNTSKIIDINNVDDVNILLPLRALVKMIQSQFNCRKKTCRKASSKMEFELETFGLANSLHVRCNCGRKSSADATLTAAAALQLESRKDGTSFKNKVNASSFEINSKILLGLQLGGGGTQELKNVTGLLNLANNPMTGRLTDLRNDIGLKILEVADEVLSENLTIEKEFSTDDEKGNKLLSVSNDARWDKRSSGRAYNSTSGCSVMMGNESKLVVGLECMSTRCVNCDSNKEHDAEICSKNYEGSAKGMEASGALTLVNRLTEEKNKCVVNQYVSDDDSSSRAKLTHSFRQLCAAGLMKKSDVPRGNCAIKGEGNGAYKWNSGELPLSHPPITMLADHNHRLRNLCQPHFTWSRGPKSKSMGVTGLDAERYKRRGGWTLRLYGGETYDEFKRHVRAFLEHHFNNHEFCGDWCKSKGLEGDAKLENGLRFRCKEENKEMYIAMKDLHDAFMDDDLLRQLHHQWNTNPVEGFNKLITKFLPKDRNYGNTIENKVRTHLAMCLLSIGYKRFYRRLFKKLGITRGRHCRRFLRAEDKERQWRKLYRKRPTVKKARMQNLYKKIREGNAKQLRDKKKGLDYDSGLMGPIASGDNDQPVLKQKATKKRKATPGVCNHCGLDTHRRITSGLCPKNPKNLSIVTSVEKGKGIEECGNSDGSQSSNGEDNNLDRNLQEGREIDALEAIPLNDVRGNKYCENDDAD